MAIDLGALFGAESAFGQILTYGVMQQVIEAMIGPALAVTTQDINARNPVVPLSPPDAADAVIRSFLDTPAGAAIAAKSGVNASDFDLMVKLAGNALSTTDLVTAYRRKLIPKDAGSPDGVGLAQGIAQGRLDPKWTDVVEALGDQPLDPADAVDAVVENQISYDEGAAWAYKSGLSPEVFRILVNTRGNPPSPTELAEMNRRGAIPLKGFGPDVLSFEQGISEGATKDKWIPAYEAIMTVEPPESVVQAWLKEGIISTDEAVTRFKLLGYDQDAATAYAAEAVSTKTTSYKQLAESDVVLLYTNRAISADDAMAMLGTLGYDDSSAAEILTVSDFHLTVQIRTAAISKIRTYYLARKISDNTVVTNLDALGVPPQQRQALISSWQTERSSNVKLLTEAQIADAWAYSIMDTVTAVTELEALGYTPYDAYVVLSVKNKGSIGPAPARGPGTTG